MNYELKSVEKDSIEYKNVEYTLHKSFTPYSSYKEIAKPLTLKGIRKSSKKYKIELQIAEVITIKESASYLISFMADLHNLHITVTDESTSYNLIINDRTATITVTYGEQKDRMSLGDILRSELPVINNKPLISEFVKDKGTPIILGVSDDQIPYMIDLDKETSINIVGGSGQENHG